MSISAKIIADSISPDGERLTTLQCQYPRFVHSEILTHRVFSRNAASSRAIPIQKMIEQVENDPAMPVWWGKNQSGMQAREQLDAVAKAKAMIEWLEARRSAVYHAKRMADIGVHKQIANRLLEPFQEMKLIVTATEWSNFFSLRRHPDAQPEIKVLADAMYEALETSKPRILYPGQWHLPYTQVDDIEVPWSKWKKLSTARCARVSYLTHDNQSPNPDKDIDLHDRLLQSGHFSPFEHVATPSGDQNFNANFRGWKSYRRELGF